MSIHKLFFFIGFGLLTITKSAFGQAAKSPFSAFGIGEIYGNALAHNQGMGGLGLSHPQVWYLNNQNPALLPYNSLTMFQAGIIGEQRDIRDASNRESVRGGNLNYLAVSFPVKFNQIVTSIGLSPYSNSNYKLQYTEPVENSSDIATVIEEGRGGLTQLYWSNGMRLNKDISVGIKASYLFGSVSSVYQNQIQNNSQTIPFIAGINENLYSKGFLIGTGFSYSKDSLFNNNYRLSIGVVYDLTRKIPTQYNLDIYKLSAISGDTIEFTSLSQINQKIELPSSFGFGISISKERRWTVGVDYHTQNWSSYQSINKNPTTLGTSWRLTAGAEFTPDFQAISYFKRVTYRTGVSYEQLPLLTGIHTVSDFGINFGFSMPAGRSSIDIALKSGVRGNITENGLKENYIKIYLGLTLNDQWFIKRKFD